MAILYNDGMKRTTVMLPEDLKETARKVAAQRRISLGTLIRAALQKEIAAARPKPKSLGIGASGRTDISRRIGEEGFEPEPWR